MSRLKKHIYNGEWKIKKMVLYFELPRRVNYKIKVAFTKRQLTI